MLFREGDVSSGVRDIQQRLITLGAGIADSERAAGRFGPETLAAVRAFQQRRGLVVDGLVGRATWRELVEASWKLGDRLLYLRSPQMRGDDTAELQQRLSRLGFDSGRIDGIFGPQTVRALLDFQHNFGLPRDGIVGAGTVRSLVGIPSRGGDTPVTSLREQETLRHMPPTLQGLTIVLDPGHGGGDPGHVGPNGEREDQFVFALARDLEAALAAAGVAVFLTRDEFSNPEDVDRGSLANAVHADLYIALHAGGSADPGASGAATYYFGNETWHSETGRRFAETVQDGLIALGLTNVRAHAKTWGVLRETRMPAIQVEPCHITNPDEAKRLADSAFRHSLAEALFDALRTFASDPRDTP